MPTTGPTSPQTHGDTRTPDLVCQRVLFPESFHQTVRVRSIRSRGSLTYETSCRPRLVATYKSVCVEGDYLVLRSRSFSFYDVGLGLSGEEGSYREKLQVWEMTVSNYSVSDISSLRSSTGESV